MTTTIIYIGSFIALLGVLVTIHEYGHFIFARIFKVHVQRFSIGMGPVVYKRIDKHGSEFALSAFPLGGYVSMITNKLIELEPDIKEQLTSEQIKNALLGEYLMAKQKNWMENKKSEARIITY